MSSHVVTPPSGWERLRLLFGIGQVLAGTILTTIASVFRNQPRDVKTAKRLALSAASKNAVTKLSVSQLQYLQQPTGKTVEAYIKKHHLHYESINLNSKDYAEATLHFVDCHIDDNEGRVLLYLHGGGFVFPASPGSHVPFVHRYAKIASARLAVLEYTLAPAAKYPSQLAQAAAALEHLLKCRPASRIIVGGDSAGGNLTLALLAHLRSPHPNIQPVQLPDSDSARLLGAYCISPRCSNQASTSSYAYNRDKDIVGRESMSLFTANWQPVAGHVWSAPEAADNAFWEILYTSRILLVAGRSEVYVEDIKAVAAAMGAKEDPGAKRQLVICPDDIHVQCVLDTGQGVEDGYMLNAVLSWLHSFNQDS